MAWKGLKEMSFLDLELMEVVDKGYNTQHIVVVLELCHFAVITLLSDKLHGISLNNPPP